MVDQAESDAEDDVRAGEGQPTTRATQTIALTKQAPEEVKHSPTPGTATAAPGADLLSLLIVGPSLRLRPPPPFSLSPMSGLARDAAAFKSALHKQDYTSWHSQPPPPQLAQSTAASAGDGEPPKKKKRPKSSTSLLLGLAAHGESQG